MKKIVKTILILIGTISTIKIIEDCDLIELYGALGKWFEAYSMFINRVGGFLFGWIHINIDLGFLEIIFQIEKVEYHFLILSNILVSSLCRASIKEDEYIGLNSEPSNSKLIKILYPYTKKTIRKRDIIKTPIDLLLIAILFPYGVILAFLIIIICIYVIIFWPKKSYEKHRKIYIDELKGIAILFATIIIVNYSIFKIL